jgi:UDPglucose--hexose-1-phosphate uridylyltransferase
VQELRFDDLTGEQVILAPARAMRPNTFRVQGESTPARVDSCPFCSGNEHETPPEVARVGPGAPDQSGWHVRVVPNKYPLVGDGVGGAHEVVILSGAHDADLGALSTEACTSVFTALRDRARIHLDAGSAYALPFVNHGTAAGASIAHPHAQLIALDDVPPRAARLVQRWTQGERDLVVDDRRAGTVVTEIDGATVWCPYASLSPFVMRAACNDAGPSFARSGDDAIAAIAEALRNALERLHRVLDQPAYNLIVCTAPREYQGPFHWWVDLVPRLTTVAGFEMGAGVWVNIVAPDAAAAALRGDA